MRAPELRGRGWLNTGGEDLLAGRPARPVRAARLLDLLLRQLPARPRRAAAAGGEVRRRARRRRACTRRSSCTRPTRTRWSRPSSATASSTRCSTTRSWSPGRPTPRGPGRRWCSSTRRATSSRSTPARGTPTRSTRCSPSSVEEHRAKGTLQPGDSPYVAPAGAGRRPAVPGQGRSRFLDGGFLVADAGHHDLVELAPDAETVVRRIGSGSAASWTAAPRRSTSPTGCACCPRTSPPRSATTSSSPTPSTTRCAGSDLGDGDVTDPGRQRRPVDAGRRRRTGSRAPWDVAWWQDRVWVAMAGIHQLWTFDPAHRRDRGRRPARPTRGCSTARWPRRGSRRPRAWPPTATGSGSRTARPPRCATSRTARCTPSSAGALRLRLPRRPADEALLQHPLGVTVLPDGSVAVCDTYNGAVRRYDRATATMTTLATGLAEPSGAVRRRRPPRRRRVGRAPAHPGAARRGVATGRRVRAHHPAAGHRGRRRRARARRRLHARRRARRSTTGSARRPSWSSPRRRRRCSARARAAAPTCPGRSCSTPPSATGVLHVAARAASCDDDGGEGAACHLHQQDWGVPVRVTAGGDARSCSRSPAADPAPTVARSR